MRGPAFAAVLLAAGCGRSPECRRLLDHLDDVKIRISLHAFAQDGKDPGGGIRSLVLYASEGVRIIDHGALWRDGSPASIAVRVPREKMGWIVEEMERRGVWRSAELSWSPARPEPKGQPPVETPFRGGLTVRPSCTVTAVYTDGEYHVHAVRALPWDAASARLVGTVAAQVPAAEALAETCGRFLAR